MKTEILLEWIDEAIRAENRKKVSKKSSRAFGPESQISPEKVRKSPESLQKMSFGDFFLLGTFLRLRAGRPGKTYFRDCFHSRFSVRRVSRLL